MNEKETRGLCLLFLILFLPAALLSQGQRQKITLILNGNSTDVPVIQVDGHPYAGLEALAGALNGTLSSSGRMVALSLPAPAAENDRTPAAPATSAPAPSPSFAQAAPGDSGFSREFLRAGIEAMSTLREWHTALEAAIQNGFLSAAVLAPYRANATTNLRLASVAVNTPSDKSAYALLNNAFQMMAGLSDKYVNMRANLTYIAPDALKDDNLNGRLLTCGRSLGAMAASGQFTDDGSCH
jgi:hypothetical protein